MSKDPNGGGTQANGAKSKKYCSLCFGEGAFYYTGTDVKAYQRFVVDQMVKDGWMRPVAWLLTRRIPKLERWRA